MASKRLPLTPTLDQKHNGVPARLLGKAQRAKSLIQTVATKVPRARQRLPVIPQGVERAQFFRAIDELSTELGSAHVEINDKPLNDGWYMEPPNTHDGMAITDDEDLVASAVVYPGNTEDVQKIVIWANKHLIPLHPISMGRNFGYGGAAPRVRGAVVIDLGKRMNKIMNIDPDDLTCLVEPGVSYYALYEEVQRLGYSHLWIDVPDLGGGSVVGNALDHGVGYTPYGDHWSMHSGMEVVLPTGEVVRTGMGALPGNNTWQVFPYGYGPFVDGIFSQSNFGIVTKMGFGLMPNPGGHESFLYTFQKEEDLDQLVEIVRPLRIAMILDNAANIRHALQVLALSGKPRTAFYEGEGMFPTDKMKSYLKEHPYGECTWLYFGTCYGPKEVRQLKLDTIHREFMKVPGARRIDPATLPPNDYFWSRDKISAGEPDLEELAWVNWQPNGAHVAFSPVAPTRGVDAMRLWEMAKVQWDASGLDFFFDFIVGLRELHLVVEAVYDRDDPKQRDAALTAMRWLISEAAKHGYGEYRTHLLLSDQVASTYSWNDNALMHLNERIKDCLDPNGILAPGRNGIWPARYRGRGWELYTNRESSEGNGVAPAAASTKL
ncbi:aryl-alcohol oxidase [Penicillium concentricum]|uniref:Aryl-alcohol oxidase n=1 Tax=Penicillium concentricum TaxID=293559 RepID=A0A9X0B294_9EURO|nr:aryl-alcohol oxidase [Penicillium concentricum]KAJ5385551.1 aryl-alcohol oxidase [Penicillium concentricum]